MLYALFVITLAFLILNFTITQGDYLHPSTLFCELFAVYELICIMGQRTYQITLHAETIYVMICGFSAFTIGGILTQSKLHFVKNASVPQKQQNQLRYIQVPEFFSIYSNCDANIDAVLLYKIFKSNCNSVGKRWWIIGRNDQPL